MRLPLLLSLLFSTNAFAQSSSDWLSHPVALRGGNEHVEVLELPYTAPAPARATLLLIPGFFQNSYSFDVLPERGISIARYLMQEFHLKIYLLNARGLGHASPGARLSLDDLAMTDLPAGIHWVTAREHSKIYVLGHSQGGITLQASLGGLDACGRAGHCFRTETASRRQSELRGVALSGSNVAMTVADESTSDLSKLGRLGRKLKPAILRHFDAIRVKDLVTSKWLASVAYTRPWEFLYHRDNVSRESMLALYQRTIEGSWARVIGQYIDGINSHGLAALNTRPETARYADALAAVKVPVVSVTYGLDPMAEPAATLRDDFERLGSPEKRAFSFDGQGHEDFMMNASLHADWLEPMRWLLEHSE